MNSNILPVTVISLIEKSTSFLPTIPTTPLKSPFDFREPHCLSEEYFSSYLQIIKMDQITDIVGLEKHTWNLILLPEYLIFFYLFQKLALKFQKCFCTRKRAMSLQRPQLTHVLPSSWYACIVKSNIRWILFLL